MPVRAGNVETFAAYSTSAARKLVTALEAD
jgi:hypothetical protein